MVVKYFAFFFLIYHVPFSVFTRGKIIVGIRTDMISSIGIGFSITVLIILVSQCNCGLKVDYEVHEEPPEKNKTESDDGEFKNMEETTTTTTVDMDSVDAVPKVHSILSHVEAPKTAAGKHETTGHGDLVHEISKTHHGPVTVDLSQFQTCVLSECQKICGSKDEKVSKCDHKTNQLCICSVNRFVTSDVNGSFAAANTSEPMTQLCSTACNSQEGYARIWTKPDGTKHCICLSNQKTKTGITLCDALENSYDSDSECRRICQSDAATCTFHGACICQGNWMPFFNLSMPNVRGSTFEDNAECTDRCLMYHHDFVPRIYDTKLAADTKQHKTYGFKAKYCLCGPEEVENSYEKTKAIIAQGFQVCTGLQCKQRCGMREAICEPMYRRACLCRRQNIFIGPHLWTRLPSNNEKFCQDTCFSQGLHARVIEKNPLLNPAAERFQPWYRKSLFQYKYDGKFCHCIKIELDLDAFRPCTDELCRWLCGHDEAVCDVGTRRNCICNTHQLIAGLGRHPDPGEHTCDITCRYHLQDSHVIDMTWETKTMDGWGVTKSKFCGCIRPISPAGLTHCDGMHDICPKLCNNPEAYCTRDKYCHCGINSRLLNKGTIRLPNGKEADECGEKCRSWMWPVAEDKDNTALIYDESRVACSVAKNCTEVDTSPWTPNRPGSLARDGDAASDPSFKKYCLCVKTQTIHYAPGTRFYANLVPYRSPKVMECIGNHTCSVVGNSIHIKV